MRHSEHPTVLRREPEYFRHWDTNMKLSDYMRTKLTVDPAVPCDYNWYITPAQYKFYPVGGGSVWNYLKNYLQE